jgi:large subunit ribosomal protein L4
MNNMELKIIDINGKETGKIQVLDTIFGATVNQSLLAQYIRVFTANARQGTSSTKTRGEVRGGGRKPWRQKGTGRARHGSSRSPIWVGGGITHGPKPKSWTLSLPKKMKKLALISALSFQAKKDSIKVLESINFDSAKTKDLDKVLKVINKDNEKAKTLIVTQDNNISVRRSAQNLSNTQVSMVQNLNTLDVLRANSVILEKDAVSYLNEKYAQI